MATPCTPLGTATTILGMCKPVPGEVGWSAAIDANWDTVDAQFKNPGGGIMPIAAAPGSITLAGVLTGSKTGTPYTTTSATFVDVDATNLKVSLTIPTGSKFILVAACLCVVSNTLITDGLAHVQILAAGTVTAASVYVNKNTVNPIGQYTIFGVVSNPTAGAGSIALQFKGDGTNAFVLTNPDVEGTGPVTIARLMFLVTA